MVPRAASRVGRSNPLRGGMSAAANALLDPMVGEACAYVQGESLKAQAVFLVRLTNSPITRTGNGMKLTKLLIITGLLALLEACSGDGRHHRLYDAILTYGIHLTVEQADLIVDEIAKRVAVDTGRVVRLSDSEAETVAVDFARGKVAPARWADAAGFAVVMVQLQTDRFTSTNQIDNFQQAVKVLSSAYSEPVTAPEKLDGLLNGTQAEEVTALAGHDDDGARKLLDAALQVFFRDR